MQPSGQQLSMQVYRYLQGHPPNDYSSGGLSINWVPSGTLTPAQAVPNQNTNCIIPNASQLNFQHAFSTPILPQRTCSPLQIDGRNTAQQHSTGLISNSSPIPRFFGFIEFDVVERLGTGMFGHVLLVRHKRTRAAYALKVCSKVQIVRLKQVEHMMSEKQIMQAVQHPNLVRLYGTFQDAVNLYLVMEPVLGGELFTILRNEGALPEPRARFYTAQLITALEFLHKLNIVYRDLKPENILLDTRGYVKLTDFGFAKHIPDNRTFTMCGTADYLAPEIIMGRGYGREVDWWALGVLIFEMLVGYPPFYDDNPYVIYENVINGAINWPPAPLPPQPDHLLRGLLQRDVTKRWGDTLLEDRNLRRHAWFQTIDWARLHDAPAPWIPRIAHEFDASNFEILPEDEQMQQQGLDPNAPLPVVPPDTFANF